MFVSVKVFDVEGKEYFERFNPFHVTRISIADPRNVDAGCYLHLRTGDMIFTPEPIDILDKRFTTVIEQFTNTMLIQIVSEYAQAQEEVKPKRRSAKE